jgi:hypothetical protein
MEVTIYVKELSRSHAYVGLRLERRAGTSEYDVEFINRSVGGEVSSGECFHVNISMIAAVAERLMRRRLFYS